MFLIIGATFAAFFVWRVVGAKLASKNRAQAAAMYQVFAVVGFIGGVLGGSKLSSALPPPLPEFPALSALFMTTVPPLICGAIPALIVWGIVAALPVAAPTRAQRAAASNPFDDPSGEE